MLKARVLEVLRVRGPMTAAELARELGTDTKRLHGCIKALSFDGQIYPVSGGRKMGNVWAVRWVWEKEEEKDLEI